MANPFQTYHPAVAFAYLACAIVFTMAAMHPVCVALSLAGSLLCSCVVRGGRATARSLAWVVPLMAVVAIANPIFVASGSTELFRVGARAFYLESLVYGLCSGGMLVSVLLWFTSYSACMNSENSMALFGNLVPAVTLLVSQVLRLVPQFVARGRDAASVQRATSAARLQGKREQAADRMRVVSVLMGWGMEDGLVRSDAMRARGYGCGKRTSYRRLRFRRADAAALAIVGVLALLAAGAAVAACAGFSFYPIVGPFVRWWMYVPYVAFMALPCALACREWWQWKSCR